MTAKDDRAGSKGEAASFEDALTRLELIVQDLESKELSLEETLTRYEEGSKLVLECRRRLDAAEQRIRTISGVEDQAEDSEEADKDEEPGDLPF